MADLEKYVIISMPDCVWCDKAKKLLEEDGSEYVEFNLLEHQVLKDFFKASGLKTVPQVFLNGSLIGGYTDLAQLLSIQSNF